MVGRLRFPHSRVLRPQTSGHASSKGEVMASIGSDRSSRSNALWGRGGRRAGAAIVSSVCAFAAATAAAAAPGISAPSKGAFVQPSLASAALVTPNGSFDVIVEGDRKGATPGFVKKSLAGVAVKRQFRSIEGIQANLTGKQVQQLAHVSGVTAILPNEPVKVSSA